MPKTISDTSRGFTIVELLIVIVVIAILAAISIIAFTGIQERARVSDVSSSLVQAKKKIALWQVDNAGSTPADLAEAGVTPSGAITYQYTPGTNGLYCITATSGTTSYKITRDSSPTSGGCDGHGSGGVAPITNLAINPSFESTLTGVNSGSYGGTTFTISRGTSGGKSGAAFARGTSNASTTSYAGGLIINLYEVKEGEPQHVELSVRSSRTIRVNARMWMYASTTPGASYLGSANDRVISSGVVLNANQWTRLSATITPPATALTSCIILQATSGTGQALWQPGDTIDVDAIMVAKGSGPYNYSDGDSPGWVWNGTEKTSSSTGPPQ